MTWVRVLEARAGWWYCWYAPADDPQATNVQNKYVMNKSLKAVIKKSRSIAPDGPVVCTYIKRD
jgi:hypothetical protein